MDSQRVLRYHLRRVGVVVEAVDSGSAAIEQAKAGIYDLILMDMQMPCLDGYSTTSTLRQAGYRGPIIALTAHAMAGDRENASAPVARIPDQTGRSKLPGRGSAATFTGGRVVVAIEPTLRFTFPRSRSGADLVRVSRYPRNGSADPWLCREPAGKGRSLPIVPRIGGAYGRRVPRARSSRVSAACMVIRA